MSEGKEISCESWDKTYPVDDYCCHLTTTNLDKQILLDETVERNALRRRYDPTMVSAMHLLQKKATWVPRSCI